MASVTQPAPGEPVSLGGPPALSQRKLRGRGEGLLSWSLLSPSILFLFLLILVPIAQAFLLAFQNADGDFTMANFTRMVSDTNFQDALKFTLLLLLCIVPLQIAIALGMALLIHSRFRGYGLFLYIFALPLAISDLAAGITWLSIFTERGYLNTILNGLGLIDKPILYLSYQNPVALFLTIVVAESWRATAIVMTILLAGLQLIPRDYFEAADVFGANGLKRIWYVILPLLRPSLQSALIIRTIFAFQTFSVVLALAGKVVPVLAGESYSWYITNRNPSVASAYGILIVTFTILAVFFYFRILGTSEAEAGLS